MKRPHEYHPVRATPSKKVQLHNGSPSHPAAPMAPVMEVKRTACNYSTGKSMGAPTGKPGMTTSRTC